MSKPSKRGSNKYKHTCNACGLSLSSAYTLKTHLETKCSTEKNFICDICDAKLLTSRSLATHMKSLHYGEKKFVCSWCGNRFFSKGQLKVHERSHTKEKSFVCDVCGKGFCHRESLVTHSTLHSGIKPYACECCSATFSCVGNLIKHRKVRAFTCGLPIYTNKKICKRAGVKCPKSSSKVKTETASAIVEEIVFESPVAEASETDPLSDHQYIAYDPSHADIQLEDYTKKEMDVFDYIGIEIKNIQEQEEREKLQLEAMVDAVEIFEEPEIESIEIHETSIEELEQEEVYLMDAIDPVDSVETIIIINSEEEFSNHVDIVDDSTFQCKYCPKIYQKMNITVKHIKVEHGIVLSSYNYDNANRYRIPQKTLDWKCSYCPRRYTSKRLAERHEAVHGPEGDLIFKCSCCVIHFKTSKEMEAHQNAEHEERLLCKTCKKRFDHPEKLTSHSKYAHSSKKSLKKYNFYCQLCGRNFNTKVALSDHERSDCGKNPIYQCNYCEKNYHSAGSLKCHLTIHTKTFDFVCTFCDKPFRTKGQLTVHLRSHTKEKNYKCSHCPAEFSHRESLLTHNTIHTGIKRFECSSCGSRFSCISNLLAHRKSHKNTCGSSRINKVTDAENSVKMIKNGVLGN